MSLDELPNFQRDMRGRLRSKRQQRAYVNLAEAFWKFKKGDLHSADYLEAYEEFARNVNRKDLGPFLDAVREITDEIEAKRSSMMQELQRPDLSNDDASVLYTSAQEQGIFSPSDISRFALAASQSVAERAQRDMRLNHVTPSLAETKIHLLGKLPFMQPITLESLEASTSELFFEQYRTRILESEADQDVATALHEFSALGFASNEHKRLLEDVADRRLRPSVYAARLFDEATIADHPEDIALFQRYLEDFPEGEERFEAAAAYLGSNIKGLLIHLDNERDMDDVSDALQPVIRIMRQYAGKTTTIEDYVNLAHLDSLLRSVAPKDPTTVDRSVRFGTVTVDDALEIGDKESLGDMEYRNIRRMCAPPGTIGTVIAVSPEVIALEFDYATFEWMKPYEQPSLAGTGFETLRKSEWNGAVETISPLETVAHFAYDEVRTPLEDSDFDVQEIHAYHRRVDHFMSLLKEHTTDSSKE